MALAACYIFSFFVSDVWNENIWSLLERLCSDLSLLQSTEITWFVSSPNHQPITFQFPQTHIQKRHLASPLCHLMPCLLQTPHIQRWYNCFLRGYYIVVITVTGLKDGWQEFDLWQAQGFSSLPQHSHKLWSPPGLFICWVLGSLSLEVKGWSHESNRSPLPSAKFGKHRIILSQEIWGGDLDDAEWNILLCGY